MRTFLQGRTEREQADAAALIKLVEERGNSLREPHSKPVEPGLFELRRNQVRIFYTFRPGRRIVLLEGIVKKQDRIPARDLERMRAILRALLALEAKGERHEL
jgi:hypothetical protein